MIDADEARDRGLGAPRGIILVLPVAVVVWTLIILGGHALWTNLT